jgi:hypothetical protein
VGGLVKRHYIMNDVVLAMGSLLDDTNWLNLQLSEL